MSIRTHLKHWAPVEISKIKVGERQRPVLHEHVEQLRQSYARLGGQLQLQPVVLDNNYLLIDGAHRLEAARRSGWTHIAAVIIDELSPQMRSFLEIESNRVRKNLTPIELEKAWREHYEPLYRAAAQKRRSQGLKKGTQRPVIGNSNNGERAETYDGFSAQLDVERVTLSKAAKQVTGLSIESLNKIAEIRAVAEAVSADENIRHAATLGLKRIGAKTASIEGTYRNLRANLQRAERAKLVKRDSSSFEQERSRQLQNTLDQVLQESTGLTDRLRGSLAFEIESAARLSRRDREHLRAVRVALAKSLATVVSAECRLAKEPLSELKIIGAEVSRLLSSTSLTQLKSKQ